MKICPKCNKSNKKFFKNAYACTDCCAIEQREHYRKNYQIGNSRWINTITSQTKGRAKKLNIPFDEQAVRIALKNCPEVCPVFKTKFVIGEGAGPKESSPTLDRIIPENGYVTGNVCVISWKANRLKNNSSFEELLQVVEWLDEQNS